MIIVTRYRDIPFEEALKCAPTTNNATAADWWEAHRGRAVEIITPAVEMSEESAFICNGPLFRIANAPPSHRVCPHIAEIGD